MYFALIFDVKHTFSCALCPKCKTTEKAEPSSRPLAVPEHIVCSLYIVHIYSTQIPLHQLLHSFDVNFKGHTICPVMLVVFV